MDYKDEVSRNTAIKKEHLTELSTAITALATRCIHCRGCVQDDL